MKTAVMTDTNSGISPAEGAELGIYVLPMPEVINGRDYLECEGITLHEFYTLLAGGAEASSSQPSPEDFTALFDRAFADGYDEIVYIPMSSALSGSCQTAASFAREYGGRVQVVDNRRISVTMRASCLDALSLRERGFGALEIKKRLDEHAYDQSIYVTVATVKRLVRTGRITAAGAAIADVLNLKPVLQVQGGKVDAFAKARGTRQAEKLMIETMKKDLSGRFGDIPHERLMLMTASSFVDDHDAAAWTAKVQAAFPEFDVRNDPLSCSLSCHVGANAYGIGVSVREA